MLNIKYIKNSQHLLTNLIATKLNSGGEFNNQLQYFS